MAKTAYMHVNNPDCSPEIYHKLINQVSETHNYETRLATRNNIVLPQFRNNYKKHSFHYNIAITWNSFPYPVKLAESRSRFIDAMRRYMLDNRENQ